MKKVLCLIILLGFIAYFSAVDLEMDWFKLDFPLYAIRALLIFPFFVLAFKTHQNN
jgi:amino acid permease